MGFRSDFLVLVVIIGLIPLCCSGPDCSYLRYGKRVAQNQRANYSVVTTNAKISDDQLDLKFDPHVKSVIIGREDWLENEDMDRLECFAKIVGQFLERRGHKILLTNLTDQFKSGTVGGGYSVYVYHYGYHIPYFGLLEPEIFLTWMSKLPRHPITLINSEYHMQQFNLDMTKFKVIGYFKPGSKSLKQYEKLATHTISADINYYAVTNTRWSLHLDIMDENILHIYGQFEDAFSAKIPATNFSQFRQIFLLKTTPIFQEVTSENIHRFLEILNQKSAANLLIIFYNRRNDVGKTVMNLLQKYAHDQSNSKKYKGELAIWAIDWRRFPGVDWTFLGLETFPDDLEPVIGFMGKEKARFHHLNMTFISSLSNVTENLDDLLNQLTPTSISTSQFSPSIALKNDTSPEDHLFEFDKKFSPKKAKRIKFKRPKSRRKKDPNLISSIPPDPRPDHSDRLVEICDYELELVKTRVHILEERVLFLEEVIEHLIRDRGEKSNHKSSGKKDPKSQLLTKDRNKHKDKNRSNDQIDNRTSDQSIVKTPDQPIVIPVQENMDISLPDSSLSRKGNYKKAPRRCSRRNLKKCNSIEYHTTVNPIMMYFVCAFLISMLRAMRITVSYYICPVVDDWRDFLRRKLPRRVQRWLRKHNVRF